MIVPIETSDLLAGLQRHGYKIAKSPRIPIGLGASIETAGTVAQLGETEVDMDLRHGIIGVESGSSKDTIAGFRQLLDILKNDLRMDPERSTWFVETITELSIQGTQRAIAAIRDAYSESALVKAANKVLGEPTGFFGIRIGSKESEPSGPDWFDLRIEPMLRNLEVYYVNLVYRSSDSTKVLRFAEGIESKISEIIGVLEGHPAEGISTTNTTRPARPKRVASSARP